METLKFDVAIIGGGASGLMCACVASKKNDQKIVVVERDNRVGKKILVSGNGRCNLTNMSADALNYNTSFFDGVNSLLKRYPPKAVISYFSSIGLLTTTDSENRVYPLSKQASAVLSVLRNELKRNGVFEICDTEVKEITKHKDFYKLNCKDKTIIAKKIVIATGGKNNYAQKVIGNTYMPAQSLGHKLTSLSPSLSPVKVKNSVVKSLKGIRTMGEVTAIINEKPIKSEKGEIQFGSDSLSGICVFNLSSVLNRENSAYIYINLLPDYSFLEIKEMINSRISLVKNGCVQELFTGMFHKNIAIALLKTVKIDINKAASTLTKDEINFLCTTIGKWKFETIKSNDFSSAQVTSGGIISDEINPVTLMSKKAKDVYFCGEAIDVDGDCGGYNLQFAFMSGMCVGEQL